MKTKFLLRTLIVSFVCLFVMSCISYASVQHDMSWEIGETTHAYGCSICGYVSIEEEPHDYSDGECTVCGRPCDHDMSWEIDEHKHAYGCSICGEVSIEEEPHDYSDGECTVCGRPCDHDMSWEIDDKTHAYACEICGEVSISETAHTYSDGECSVCGNECSHNDWNMTYSKHTCKDCGKSASHTRSWAIDDNTHSSSCSDCGYVYTSETKHTFSSITGKCYTCDYECEHDASWELSNSAHKCSRCKKTFSHEISWAINADTHTSSCSVCGYDSEKGEAHTYSDYECTVCGAPCAHKNMSWEIDAKTHAYACSDCGYVSIKAVEHNLVNGKCTVCSVDCVHTSWEIDANVHTCVDCGFTSKHEISWAIDTNTHCGSCHICGQDVTGEVAHTYSDGKCTVCGEGCKHDVKWEITTTEHKCAECGYKSKHNLLWAIDDETHTYSCSECGYDKYKEVKHTFVNSKCLTCKYECEHKTTKLDSNYVYHWEACAACGKQIGDKDTHTLKYRKCTVCGYYRSSSSGGSSDYEDNDECEHTSGDWEKDETNHWKVCTDCGEYTESKSAHTFSGNTCTICGYTKSGSGDQPGDDDECEHTSGNWEKDETNHWKVCTKCGELTENKTAHTFDGNTCTICGYTKSESGNEPVECEHTPSDWKKNKTYHWKVCTKCKVYTTAEEKHTFKSGECTVCGYDKDSANNDTDISVSPKSGSTVEYGDRIRIMVEDDDEIDYVEYYWNDGDSTKRYSDDFTVKVPSEDGKNYLYVRAVDGKGNKTSYEDFVFYVEESYYPGNSDYVGKLNKSIKDLRVEIGNVDDKIVYEPGEAIEYYINYYNGTSSRISNAKIVVEVPNTNFKMVDVDNDGTKTTKKVTWNLGTLKAGDDGRVYFTMEYNDSKDLDNDLIFNLEAKIYKGSKVQDTSFTRNMIYNEKSKTQDSHSAYVSGYPDGRVNPDGTITRAEMASMIARMAGINVNGYTYRNTYSDVHPDHWAAATIQACVDNGLVKEIATGRFEPELPATRAMISYAIAKILDIEDVEPIYIRASDTQNNEEMASVEQMIRLNIIDGYSNGTAKPEKPITRAEAMVIINKYLFRGQLFVDNNYGYYLPEATGLKQFTDLSYGHWAYTQIMEATNNHNYVRTYDGNETLVY